MTIFWQIVTGILASVGGVAGLIIIIIKVFSNTIAERLSKKYELKLNKELEKYKSNLDSKIYITKAKFDKEFELYQQLSRNFFLMIEKINSLYPLIGVRYADDSLQAASNRIIFNEAKDATIEAQKSINTYAAFIKKEFYENYKGILKECRGLLCLYNPDKQPKDENFQTIEKIIKMFEELNDKLREYLSKLEVIEGEK